LIEALEFANTHRLRDSAFGDGEVFGLQPLDRLAAPVVDRNRLNNELRGASKRRNSFVSLRLLWACGQQPGKKRRGDEYIPQPRPHCRGAESAWCRAARVSKRLLRRQ
jgi:hypothetical protein